MLERFFISTTPGFEQILRSELELKWQYLAPELHIPDITTDRGGIEICTNLETALLLNHHLKSANRILWRLFEFKCRDFPKLFNKAKKIPWNKYVGAHIPAFEISAHNSRVFDSRKIENTLVDGINKYRQGNPPRKKYEDLVASTERPIIFVRLVDDICTISIDTSGEQLNKRNYRKENPQAPLRENLAAALLLEMIDTLDVNHEKLPLVDPMCGSGTFLWEAETFWQAVTQRNFAYQTIPLLEGKTSNVTDIDKPTLIKTTFGHDIDQRVIDLAKTTASNIEIDSHLSLKDIFQDDYSKEEKDGLVICNPPYGIRIKIEGKLTDYYSKLIKHINEKLSPRGIGIIIPGTVTTKQLTIPSKLRLKKTIPFKNGGIEVNFLIFKVAFK